MSQLPLGHCCNFLPLAITRSDETYGCIGAIAEDSSWVRPEPIYLEDVERPDSSYRYFYWTSARLNPSTADEMRPEDRDLSETDGTPKLGSPLPDMERLPFLLKHADANVAAAFVEQRSLGLVEVCVECLYVKRSTGGKFFIRGQFSDSIGERHDWIIPEIAFGRVVWPHVVDGVLTASFAELLHETFQKARTFFAIGLTKPNFRFPGKFRNCHPLIVGIHSEPNYLPQLEDMQGSL